MNSTLRTAVETHEGDRREHHAPSEGTDGDRQGNDAMIVQCRVCKRIRVNGHYRLPWPGELTREVAETYCPRCAADTLERIQSGEYARTAARRLHQRARHAF